MQIYIPVIHARHWFLYVIQVKKEVCEIWDSLLLGTTSMSQVIFYDVVSPVLYNLNTTFRISKCHFVNIVVPLVWNTIF